MDSDEPVDGNNFETMAENHALLFAVNVTSVNSNHGAA